MGEHTFSPGDMLVDVHDLDLDQAVLVLAVETEWFGGPRYLVLLHSYTTGRTYCTWYTASGLSGLESEPNIFYLRRSPCQSR